MPEVQPTPYVEQPFVEQPFVEQPYVNEQPFVPELGNTPYVEQPFVEQPYVNEQPFVPQQSYVPETVPYQDEQLLEQQQQYLPEAQPAPYFEEQPFGQQAVFDGQEPTEFLGEQSFGQQNFVPEVETSQYLGGGGDQVRKSIYAPAQTPLVDEPGAPLTESVNASYFGPGISATLANSNYKVVAKGKGINNNEINQIISTCYAALKNKAIPLSKVCAEGIKARIGGEWFVFISDNGMENFNFSMTRCKGSDYLVFIVGGKKFQVCRLKFS